MAEIDDLLAQYDKKPAGGADTSDIDHLLKLYPDTAPPVAAKVSGIPSPIGYAGVPSLDEYGRPMQTMAAIPPAFRPADRMLPPTLNAVGGDQFVPDRATPNRLSQSYQQATNALMPSPGTTYGSMLPFARDDATGALRFALPGAVRDFAQGAVDLAYGPATGAVTPAATGALAQIALPGYNRSPAYIPGRFSVFPLAADAPTRTPSGALNPAGRAANVDYNNNPLVTQPSPWMRYLTEPTQPAPIELPVGQGGAVPAFVPPNTPGQLLPRIRQIIEADERTKSGRPAQIPPGDATAVTTPEGVPLAGPRAPIVQPPNPLVAGESGVTPLPGIYGGAPDVTKGPFEPIQAPRSAGAAGTPYVQSGLTADQAAEYGSTADKQWLYKSMPPGEADPTEYIPGISPTMAQREQTVQAARETKATRNLSTAADQAERELLDEHNTKRKDFFQETAGSDVTQGIAMREADKNIDNGLTAAFRHGGQVNPQPITDAIGSELTAPSGKLPAVRAVMKTISDALEKSDGTGLETDPRQVYGVRRVINFLQSKRGLAENPGYGDRDVQAALIRVKNAIDGAIEPAAPGFRDAISNYANAQRAIEANEALQAAEPKLYDDKGRMQFSKFHNFMRDVIKSRDPNAPLNPFQSFTEDQMNRLKSIHDDLMRVSSAEELAKARGSDTVPNFLDVVKHAAQGVPGTVAAGVVGHIFGGPGGAVVGPIVKGQVESIFSRGAERRAAKRMQDLLRPDQNKYPNRSNPLQSTPEEP